MRLIVVSLLLLAIAANGFSEEVEDNELHIEEEEPGNEIETKSNHEALSENEVMITAPRGEEVEPKNEVGSPEQKKVPVKKGKARKFLEKLKEVTKKVASSVKEGAIKTASLTKKGWKAMSEGVKEGAIKTAAFTKQAAKAIVKE